MIDKNTVKSIASLARLKLDDEETACFVRDLSCIIDYVEKLKALDVSSVEPTSHVLDRENVFREDTVTPSLPLSAIQSLAIKCHAGHFQVPKVID